MPTQSISHQDVRIGYELIQAVRQETDFQSDIQTLADLEELAKQRGIHLTSPALRQAFRQDWAMRRLVLYHHDSYFSQE
jgi:hypothetical protein